MYIGTEFHKRLLKNAVYSPDYWNAFCTKVARQLSHAFDKELLLIDVFAPKVDDDDHADDKVI